MKVTVYSTPTCPYCRQVEQFLSRHSVPFDKVDVSRDPAGAAEMVRFSGQRGVPVTAWDGQVVVGYDRMRLERLVASARRPRLGAAVADAAKMAAKGRCKLTQGAYVGRVTAGGAAARAGLRAGDVITAFGNRQVNSALHLERLIAGAQLGQTVPFSYVRGDEKEDAQLLF